MIASNNTQNYSHFAHLCATGGRIYYEKYDWTKLYQAREIEVGDL